MDAVSRKKASEGECESEKMGRTNEPVPRLEATWSLGRVADRWIDSTDPGVMNNWSVLENYIYIHLSDCLCIDNYSFVVVASVRPSYK